MYASNKAENIANKLFAFRLSALLVALTLCATSLGILGLAPRAHAAANAISLSFASTPELPQASGNYQVQLKATPNFPKPDPGFMDPSRVEVGVYLVRAGQSFSPDKKNSFPQLVKKTFAEHGDVSTYSISDYLTANALPKPGDTLVPYIQTYAFSMTTYAEAEKDFIAGTPYTFPGGSTKPPQPPAKLGSISVNFVDENNQAIPGGTFKVKKDGAEISKEHFDKLTLGEYVITELKAPAGYELIKSQDIQVVLTKDALTKKVTIAVTKKAPQPTKKIPYVALTPQLAPDHPKVFVRIEDTNVHPVNGLRVFIIAPNGKTREVVDAKLNSSDETPYKILALPLSEFDQGLGNYLIRLTQKGYLDTDVPFLLAARTKLPVPNNKDGGYVYISDGKMTVETEKDAKLSIIFLVDPRLEEGGLQLEDRYITNNGDGTFSVDFAHLHDQLGQFKHVKIVAQAPGKAPSDIVTVRLKDKRPGEGSDNKKPALPKQEMNSEVNKTVNKANKTKGNPAKQPKSQNNNQKLAKTGSDLTLLTIALAGLLGSGYLLRTRKQ